MHIDFDHDQEMTAPSIDARDVLKPYLSEATFNCTVEPSSFMRGDWVDIARTKYGKPVAGLLIAGGQSTEGKEQAPGFVFLLPQIDDVGGCVVALVERRRPGRKHEQSRLGAEPLRPVGPVALMNALTLTRQRG